MIRRKKSASASALDGGVRSMANQTVQSVDRNTKRGNNRTPPLPSSRSGPPRGPTRAGVDEESSSHDIHADLVYKDQVQQANTQQAETRANNGQTQRMKHRQSNGLNEETPNTIPLPNSRFIPWGVRSGRGDDTPSSMTHNDLIYKDQVRPSNRKQCRTGAQANNSEAERASQRQSNGPDEQAPAPMFGHVGEESDMIHADLVVEQAIVNGVPMSASTTAKSKRWKFVAVLLLVIVAALVIVVVVLRGEDLPIDAQGENSLRDGGIEASITTSIAAATETPSRVSVTLPRTASIVSFINNVTASENTIAYPPKSYTAEEIALEWLVEEDPLMLSPDSLWNQFRLKQRYALLTLWFQDPTAMSTNPWIESTNWLEANDECTWHGIACASVIAEGQRVNAVTKISLGQNNLRGGIPPDIALLIYVKNFSVHSNALSGTIPSTLRLWTNLREFTIGINAIVGTLPSSIGAWTDLTFINVADNGLTGCLPPVIGAWSNVESLYFSKNGFTGSLPAEVGAWTHLEIMNFRDNKISGSLPPEIGAWTNLQEFYAYSNMLEGSLPSTIGSWSNVREFSVTGNSFGSSLPSELYQWRRIEDFRVHSNQLTGSLPGTAIDSWSTLRIINIGDNAFTGTLPNEVEKWTNLQEFYAYKNSLEGSLPLAIGAWTNLKKMNILKNSFTSSIPTSIANWTEIDFAIFHSNQFNGSITSKICDYNFKLLEADPGVQCSCCTPCCSTNN